MNASGDYQAIRQPSIGDARMTGAVEQDVLGIQPPMSQSMRVHTIERRGDLADDALHFRYRERSTRTNPCPEAALLHERHREKEAMLVLLERGSGEDPHISQGQAGAQFIFNALDETRL